MFRLFALAILAYVAILFVMQWVGISSESTTVSMLIGMVIGILLQ